MPAWVLELIGADAATPFEISTDGRVLVLGPVNEQFSGRRRTERLRILRRPFQRRVGRL